MRVRALSQMPFSAIKKAIVSGAKQFNLSAKIKVSTYISPPASILTTKEAGWPVRLDSSKVTVIGVKEQEDAAGFAELMCRTMEYYSLPDNLHFEVASDLDNDAYANRLSSNRWYIGVPSVIPESAASFQDGNVGNNDAISLSILLGHEVSHIRARYSWKEIVLDAIIKFTALGSLSRRRESIADQDAIKYAIWLGYPPSEIHNSIDYFSSIYLLSDSSFVSKYKLKHPKLAKNTLLLRIGLWLSRSHPQREKRRTQMNNVLQNAIRQISPRYGAENLAQLATCWTERRDK